MRCNRPSGYWSWPNAGRSRRDTATPAPGQVLPPSPTTLAEVFSDSDGGEIDSGSVACTDTEEISPLISTDAEVIGEASCTAPASILMLNCVSTSSAPDLTGPTLWDSVHADIVTEVSLLGLNGTTAILNSRDEVLFTGTSSTTLHWLSRNHREICMNNLRTTYFTPVTNYCSSSTSPDEVEEQMALFHSVPTGIVPDMHSGLETVACDLGRSFINFFGTSLYHVSAFTELRRLYISKFYMWCPSRLHAHQRSFDDVFLSLSRYHGLLAAPTSPSSQLLTWHHTLSTDRQRSPGLTSSFRTLWTDPTGQVRTFAPTLTSDSRVETWRMKEKANPGSTWTVTKESTYTVPPGYKLSIPQVPTVNPTVKRCSFQQCTSASLDDELIAKDLSSLNGNVSQQDILDEAHRTIPPSPTPALTTVPVPSPAPPTVMSEPVTLHHRGQCAPTTGATVDLNPAAGQPQLQMHRELRPTSFPPWANVPVDGYVVRRFLDGNNHYLFLCRGCNVWTYTHHLCPRVIMANSRSQQSVRRLPSTISKATQSGRAGKAATPSQSKPSPHQVRSNAAHNSAPDCRGVRLFQKSIDNVYGSRPLVDPAPVPPTATGESDNGTGPVPDPTVTVFSTPSNPAPPTASAPTTPGLAPTPTPTTPNNTDYDEVDIAPGEVMILLDALMHASVVRVTHCGDNATTSVRSPVKVVHFISSPNNVQPFTVYSTQLRSMQDVHSYTLEGQRRWVSDIEVLFQVDDGMLVGTLVNPFPTVLPGEAREVPLQPADELADRLSAELTMVELFTDSLTKSCKCAECFCPAKIPKSEYDYSKVCNSCEEGFCPGSLRARHALSVVNIPLHMRLIHHIPSYYYSMALSTQHSVPHDNYVSRLHLVLQALFRQGGGSQVTRTRSGPAHSPSVISTVTVLAQTFVSSVCTSNTLADQDASKKALLAVTLAIRRRLAKARFSRTMEEYDAEMSTTSTAPTPTDSTDSISAPMRSPELSVDHDRALRSAAEQYVSAAGPNGMLAQHGELGMSLVRDGQPRVDTTH